MRVEVNSKLIDEAHYDAGGRRLKIFLANGHIREFDNVPEHVINDLMSTKSPGSYYMTVIRDRYPLLKG